MKDLKPMLFSCLKNYSRQQLVKDIVAGIIVAIIALPLSIALALASGVAPEQGIYTAVVAGFIIALLGGSRVQVSGPTAAFATIVAGIVARNGMSGLAVATIMAGVILIIMGLLKLGSLIKFIPYTITTGFTAGIAVTILVGQLKDFFGVTYAGGTAPIETMDKLKAFFGGLGTLNYQALIVGLVCLAVIVFCPKILKRVPASAIAVLVGIAMVKLLGMKVNTIGDLYVISSGLPHLTIPDLSLSTIRTLLPDAFTIAVLAAIESLLSCVVADGMINSQHRSNAELVAQGIGNIGSALFGGIPATGAIARTAANVNNGGRTPISGMVHAVVLLLILVVLMPYAALIPMPTIAAILFGVAYNMCQWRPFVRIIKTAPKSDIIVLCVTFLLTVIFDLVVAIEFGILIACVLFIRRASLETGVKSWKYVTDSKSSEDFELLSVPENVRVYEFSGPLFFGVSGIINEISFKDFTSVLVLRMRSVTSLDVTAIRALEQLFDRCDKAGITVLMSHVNDQPMRALKKAGIVDRLGEDSFRPHIGDALEYAATLPTERSVDVKSV